MKNNRSSALTLLALLSCIGSAAKSAPAASFQQAVANYNAGKYAQANREIDSYKQSYPNNALVHYYSGLCKQAMGQLESAKTEFQWVINSNDPRLKPMAQTGFDQLSRAHTSVSPTVATPAATTVASAPAAVAASSTGGNGKVTKILEFYADWCGPCKEFAPTFEAVTSKLHGIQVQRVNLDENKDLAEKYSITSIPRMVMLDNKNTAIYNDSPPREQDTLTALINKYR